MCEKGIGVIKDEKEAVVWYQKAALQGNLYAQYNLAVLLLSIKMDNSSENRAKQNVSLIKGLTAEIIAAAQALSLVPYSLKPVTQFSTPSESIAYLRGIKNKRTESAFNINNLNIPPDSERRETFEARILVYFPNTDFARRGYSSVWRASISSHVQACRNRSFSQCKYKITR